MLVKACTNSTKDSYTTIKGPKTDFEANLPPRLSTVRPEFGRISKIILDRVNKLIKKRLGFVKWIHATNVINCFNNINDETNCH